MRGGGLDTPTMRSRQKCSRPVVTLTKASRLLLLELRKLTLCPQAACEETCVTCVVRRLSHLPSCHGNLLRTLGSHPPRRDVRDCSALMPVTHMLCDLLAPGQGGEQRESQQCAV